MQGNRKRASGGLATARALFVSLRPRQWIKNVLVLAAVVFAGRLGDPAALARSALALGVFCLLSGGVYLANDALDRERDRLHPVKRRRPVAAGRLGAGTAAWAAAVVCGAALLAAWPLGLRFLGIAVLFLALQGVYSTLLRRVPLVDVLAVAGGFVVRAVAGGVAIPVQVTPWLLACTFFLALLVSLGKRRRELDLLGGAAPGHRASLARLDREELDRLLQMVAPTAILGYTLYTISSAQPRELVYTVPFAVYGVFRYLWIVRTRQADADPTEVLYHDRPLQVAVVLWILAVLVILYLG